MKPVHGKLLMLTAALHTVLAPILYWEQWKAFASSFLLNIAPHELVGTPPFVKLAPMDSEAAFWFFAAGIIVILAGHLMHVVEKETGGLPPIIGWEMLGMSFLLAWMMPISGFTLIVIPQAVYIVIRQRKRPGSPEDAGG